MKGDFLVFKPNHYEKMDVIVRNILPYYQKRIIKKMVLAIGGESGTGKTEIARLVQQQLWKSYKIRSKVLSLDDYYFTSWNNRNKIRKDNGINSIGIKEIQWDKILQIIKNFKTNKRLYTQQIHMYINAIEYTIVDSKNIDILIIEGLYANYLNKSANYKIYLDGNIKDTYEFRKERNKENPDNSFRKLILDKEAKDVQKTKQNSSLIIPFNLGK